MAKRNTKLSLKQLLARENEGDGFGLYGHQVRRPSHWKALDDPYLAVKAIDEAVLQIANERGWTDEMVFDFMNSKASRWAGDEITSLKDPFSEGLINILEKYMKKG